MEHQHPTPEQASLTPNQAADVIRWYHAGENQEFRAKGYGDKVSLGQAAFHAANKTNEAYWVPPMDGPLLTHQEMARGLAQILEDGERAAQLDDYLNSPVREPDAAERAAGDHRDIGEAS